MRFVKYAIIFLASVTVFSCKKATLFQQIPSSYSNIKFKNQITETDSLNPLTLINIYNGGGVGVGDFNKDGKPDLYFTGNAVSNKLYLNKGDFKFEDITIKAGVAGKGGWARGVAVVDINNDGWPDIYVCNTLLNDSLKRTNLLYINQGNDKTGIPHFKEMAAEYGLNAHAHSTMAYFFDYDNDGDLDMYLAVNEIDLHDNPTLYRPVITDGSYHSTGRLYRNDWNAALNHPVYTDVSKQAGMNIEGYGHAASIVDINQDGWKDIYITNDFIGSDILYINNHDGTFTDAAKSYFKHTSLTAMGQDFEDINNDGLTDMFALDMNPEDNYRKKMFMPPNSYQMYQNSDYYGYQYQYPHNTLQLNQGMSLGERDSIAHPVFSEIGFLSGVSQTDWSWCPLITDFDNDGYRDIIITNGYPRDVTDHDFTTFRNEAYQVASLKQILSQIPIVKIPNYAYKNNGDLQFTDESKNWGMTVPSFSNGAVYADLDGDGDMDMIINNINDEAMVYKNTLRDNDADKGSNHYLQVAFVGDSKNIDGFGALVNIYYNHGQQQYYENTPYRGYLSTLQNFAHFGLGKIDKLDSVVVRWPNLKKQVLTNVKADQVLKVKMADAHVPYTFNRPVTDTKALFAEVTAEKGITYKNKDDDYVDFNVQKLLPHKLSEYTPAMASGDVNGDGLDDIIVGGSARYPAQVLLQQPNGKFLQKQLYPEEKNIADNFKDGALLLIDADGDGDLDLYIAGAGYANDRNSAPYRDRFYLNDGKGNFTEDKSAIVPNYTSKLCVRAIDYDKDGDLDLYVSGRVDPWNYPKPVSSLILRNDSKNGKVKFTDVTAAVAKELKNIGLVCDAEFTDFDNDGWPDLVLAGEWMPVTFLKNEKGKFKNVTSQSGISDKLGWWNTIASGDFDHDGDIDYIVGNVGLNTYYKASDKYPVYMTANDVDHNGSYDAFASMYFKDKNGEMKEYPVNTRDDAIKQVISLRIKFQNYKSYAEATMDQLFAPEALKGAIRLKANYIQSCYLRNDGGGKFTAVPLPVMAQISQLSGIVVDDFDGDGNLDVAMSGNDYGTEVTSGRYDAFNGLMLKGDGKGGFKPLSILQSGIYIPGNAKALVKLRDAKGAYLVAASQRLGPLKLFELNRQIKTVPLQPLDICARIKYKNGSSAKMEFYNGSSFLSQSARFFNIERNMAAVQITNSLGQTRNISLN
ncbi:VCBS repeat-containing protein [Mucilaginibacter sp. KACC 22063]|uniref:VCBS repeat-containing protein n=1 Tax=Mucilaginibacter sp. KACC 22063 TaxID=3025666 RepID=UPI002364FC45|nr:VCBS repeat-containing protein [Mucilaginibacter sp. KACC 22063]WDF56632.1 VCBS repeat-containing protein [Mucilaginibacter sp. KACC 22063]